MLKTVLVASKSVLLQLSVLAVARWGLRRPIGQAHWPLEHLNAFLTPPVKNDKSPSQPSYPENRCRSRPWLGKVKDTDASVYAPDRTGVLLLVCDAKALSRKNDREAGGRNGSFAYFSANNASFLIEQKPRELQNI